MAARGLYGFHAVRLVLVIRALRAAVLLALFLASAHQCWTFHPLDVALIADDQIYFFVAERAASGVAPHESLVDHKHQLAPLILAAAISVGRRFGADDVIAGRVASIVAAATAAPMVFLLAESLTGHFGAALLTGLAMLTCRTFFMEGALGYRPQLYVAVFMIASLLAYARGRRMSAGALAGCAFLCWQPAGIAAAALIGAAAFEQDRRRAVVSVAAGALLAVAVYESYFAWHGVLAEQLRQSYAMASSARGVHLPSIADSIAFVFNGEPGFPSLRPDRALAAMLLTVLPALWLFALLSPARALAAWRRSGAWRAVVLATHGTVAFTFVDHQAYPDRFFVIPFIVLMASVAACLVPVKAGLRWMVVLAAAALIVVKGIEITRPRPQVRLEDERALAHRLAELANRTGGGVWVVGRPDLLAFEHMDNWSPFGMLLDARVLEYARRLTGEPAYRPLRDGKLPKLVFVARMGTGLPWLREYERATNVEAFTNAHIRVYVQRTKPLPARPPARPVRRPPPPRR